MQTKIGFDSEKVGGKTLENLPTQQETKHISIIGFVKFRGV